MSLHANNIEAQAIMDKQRRMAFLTSTAISCLVVVLLLLLLSLFLLPALTKEAPAVVIYQSDQIAEEPTERKVKNKVTDKPSAPSAAINKVIASNMQAHVSLPITDTNVTIPSLNFGAEIDFSQGWGTGNDGAGQASFFQQKVSGTRFAYVIDYSASMAGKRQELMRKELADSVSKLPNGLEYQLIFFAGPTWVAGDEVKMKQGGGSCSVIHNGRSYEWTGQGAHNWNPVGKPAAPNWMPVHKSNIKKSLEIIQSEKLIYGTSWGPALNMALDMNPPPQVIFFMTDGDAGPQSMAVAEEVARKAKSRKVIINTVAMMEPRAEKQMALLAKKTGGKFSSISQDGTVVPKD